MVALIALIASCKQELQHENKVIFTRVPVDAIQMKADIAPDFRYVAGMQIVLADNMENPDSSIPLTAEFHSSRAAEISYDGRSMVFSGQKAAGDIWQIWIMELKNSEVRQITESNTNCTDPTWAPDGSIVYSKIVQDDQRKLQYHALYGIEANGCCEQRLTFQPHDDLDASFLNDGRIIVNSAQVFPQKGDPNYLALRPDGTKAELFYQPIKENVLQGSAIDNFSGKVVFSEAGALTRVNFNRPLHSRQVISTKAFKYIQSAYPLADGSFLVAGMKQGERSYGIAKVGVSGDEEQYFNNADYHAFEPVMVTKRPVGRKLPSRVNTDLESGYLICMNADDSQIILASGEDKSTKIQVVGMDKLMSESSIEEDGSFYLELKADVPVRLQTLNSEDEIMRGPSAWMWVRPNERRGCVGCHADPEYAPENVVPKAIEKAPFAMIN